MPIDVAIADHRAAIDEAGHCVNARKRGLHIQFTTIEHGQFFRAGQTVTGPVTLVKGADNVLLDVQHRVSGTAALLAFRAVFGPQQDVRDAIEKVAKIDRQNAEAIVQKTQDDVQTEMEQADWHGAVERVALHLLQVRTIEEVDADKIVDALL
jgi:hypothetical protein